MTTIDPLLRELEQQRAPTLRLLERVPGDRLEWRPHERSMSAGELALHIAELPAVVTERAMEPEVELFDFDPPPPPPSMDVVLETFRSAMEEAVDRLGTLDEASASSAWRLMDGDRVLLEMPRIAVVRNLLLNHLYHHRGQLTVYLRALEVPVPATFGASADESMFDRPS